MLLNLAHAQRKMRTIIWTTSIWRRIIFFHVYFETPHVWMHVRNSFGASHHWAGDFSFEIHLINNWWETEEKKTHTQKTRKSFFSEMKGKKLKFTPKTYITFGRYGAFILGKQCISSYFKMSNLSFGRLIESINVHSVGCLCAQPEYIHISLQSGRFVALLLASHFCVVTFLPL